MSVLQPKKSSKSSMVSAHLSNTAFSFILSIEIRIIDTYSLKRVKIVKRGFIGQKQNISRVHYGYQLTHSFPFYLIHFLAQVRNIQLKWMVLLNPCYSSLFCTSTVCTSWSFECENLVVSPWGKSPANHHLWPLLLATHQIFQVVGSLVSLPHKTWCVFLHAHFIKMEHLQLQLLWWAVTGNIGIHNPAAACWVSCW